MVPGLILDSVLREQFARDGFAFTPLLNPEDIAELLELYREARPRMAAGFYTTLWSEDLEYRQKVHEAIRRVLDRRLMSVPRPAKYVLTQFAVKQGGHVGTECPLHQDWSMSDESRHPSVSIWCPLVDVDASNGPLAVVPGSHRIASLVRPNMPNGFYYSPVSPLYDTFANNYLRELPMKAGGAILYDGRITHGSRPNQLPADRVAIVAALVPEGEQLLHYWMPSSTEVEVFAVEDDFYRRRVALGTRPTGSEPIEVLRLSANEPLLTEADFLVRTADVVRDPISQSAGPSRASSPGFVDEKMQQRFDQLGYEVVELFSAADLEYLRAAYEELGSMPATGFHATMYSSDGKYRQAVYQLIGPLVAERINGVLRGHRLRVANWVVKEAGQADSTVGFHQDWSFVDERRSRSMNLWFPLVDVDAQNGCLEVVAGSHRVSDDHRAHADPCRFADLTPEIRESYTAPVPMTAGQGIFYDGALLHSSARNRSSHRRIAVGTVLVPDHASLVHCHRTTPTTVEVFSVDDSFFWSHAPGTRPEGVSPLGTMDSSSSQHGVEILPTLVRAPRGYAGISA